MDATPAHLKKSPTNIYSQIAIALKGGALREPGLANLAARLVVRVDRSSHLPEWLLKGEGIKPTTLIKRGGSKLRALRGFFGFATIRPLQSQRCDDAMIGACHPGEGSMLRRGDTTPARTTPFFGQCSRGGRSSAAAGGEVPSSPRRRRQKQNDVPSSPNRRQKQNVVPSSGTSAAGALAIDSSV